ncbi:MAG: HAMP domain-containing histidine kinase [Bdellovibrionaceae bacterium]|nr:HAMP domain-containing histidine kinase [Pseudobdellovibrionaceae bacterium]NUM59241.1 HAMP domain-containing histidine kinase [Pseudobdellovibrionaceae bacterium]
MSNLQVQIAPKFDIFLRLLIIWLLSLIILKYDHNINFDNRFQLQSSTLKNNDIVIIELNPSNLQFSSNFALKNLIYLNDNSQINDNYYWDSRFWYELITYLLNQNPKAITVSLNLLPIIEKDMSSTFFYSTLFNPKVFWIKSDSFNIQDFNYKTNFLNEVGLIKDPDGIVRNFEKQLPITLTERVSGKLSPFIHVAHPINFKGSAERFEKLQIEDLTSSKNNYLKDKYVIIGARTNNEIEFNTPLGLFNRSTLLAQALENFISEQWVKTHSYLIHALTLIFIVLGTYYLTIFFVQWKSIAILLTSLFFYFLINIFIFNHFHFWMPLLSPIVTSFLTWFILITYKASQIEKNNFLLIQDQKNANEMEQLKNNFVSLISHDLKTPLAKIQAISDRLLLSPSPNLKTDIGLIKIASEELNSYIRSILNILRVESRNFNINLESCDMNELINKSIEILSPLALDKNIKINAQLEPLFPIEVDTTLIKEALQNIIENAIKYSRHDSEILITSSEINEWIKVRVKDFGVGISNDDLKIIGQKFVRGKHQDYHIKGSGLGLYLVKYFIDLHKGKVEISSEEGKYTEVVISLPAR